MMVRIIPERIEREKNTILDLGAAFLIQSLLDIWLLPHQISAILSRSKSY